MINLKTEATKSMRRLVIASALSTGLFLSAALPALAMAPPNGPGQPNESCQSFGPQPPAPPAPLNVNGFNTAGFGKAANVYAGSVIRSPHANSDVAVSQYDVACFQQAQKPH
jgi:hypothetical protein